MMIRLSAGPYSLFLSFFFFIFFFENFLQSEKYSFLVSIFALSGMTSTP